MWGRMSSNEEFDFIYNGPTPLSKMQVGGNHYLHFAIQPREYSMANRLNPDQANIIKYVTRYPFKNGIEDLEKARDTLDKLIEWEKAHV